MLSLYTNDALAELSLAYVLAVSTTARVSVSEARRCADGMGIDVTIRVKERLAPDSRRTQFALDLQLKATTKPLREENGFIKFDLDAKNVTEFCDPNTSPERVLVLLRVPGDESEWVHWTDAELAVRRCAYWTGLIGLTDKKNKSTQRVSIPSANTLSPKGLRDLLTRVSRREVLSYEG